MISATMPGYLLQLLLFLLPPPQLVSAEYSPAYSHDTDIPLDRSSWMADLPNSTLLLSLSLPGTHDTMAFYGGDITHTQTLPLPVQLRAGIRVVDIRCRHIDNKFAIHHGRIFQHAWFDTVLDGVVAFLAANLSEVVLMRVSKNYKDHNNTRSFADTFVAYQSMAKYASYFWYPKEHGWLQLQLGSLRGKIVVLDEFSDAAATGLSKYGLSYSLDFNTQDEYVLRTNWDLYGKWEKVKTHLEAANSDRMPPSGNRSKIYLNYLSGSTGVLPFFVASGHITHGTEGRRLPTGFTQPPWPASKWPDFPRDDCVLHVCEILFEGTNTLAYNYILNSTDPGYVGVIVVDFPGPGLIEAVIGLNFKGQPRPFLRKSREMWISGLSMVNSAEFVFLMSVATLGACTGVYLAHSRARGSKMIEHTLKDKLIPV